MPQKCFSYNNFDPEDFSEKNLHVFISYDDVVYPCCMTASQNQDDGASLDGKTLKEILDTPRLDMLYYDHIESGNPIKFCVETCGK